MPELSIPFFTHNYVWVENYFYFNVPALASLIICSLAEM